MRRGEEEKERERRERSATETTRLSAERTGI